MFKKVISLLIVLLMLTGCRVKDINEELKHYLVVDELYEFKRYDSYFTMVNYNNVLVVKLRHKQVNEILFYDSDLSIEAQEVYGECINQDARKVFLTLLENIGTNEQRFLSFSIWNMDDKQQYNDLKYKKNYVDVKGKNKTNKYAKLFS